MRRTISALIQEDRYGHPFAFIDGLPGRGATLTPEELQQLARQLTQIAIDAKQGARGATTYTTSD